MSNVDQLLALGAQVVGGDLIWKHKVLGQFRNGDFHITDEGTKALDIVDVEVKEAKPRARKPKTIEFTDVDVLDGE